MNAPPDPPRMIDASTSDPLRRMLDAGRADAPGAEQMARIAARASALGAPPGGAPGGGAAPSPMWSSPLFKAGLAAVAVGLVGGGLALRGDGRAPTDATPPVIAPAASAAPAPPIEAAPEPALTASAAVSAPVPAPRPIAPQRRDLPRTPSATASASASAEALPPAEGASEMDLLARAQRSLSSSPAAALALCEEHEARFGGGELAPEREVIAITALVALGRRDEARARGDRFRAAHPRSAYLRRIEVVLSR